MLRALICLMQEGKMKIKSTLLNNCEQQLQLNSQVSGCSWRCWIHRFQAALLDETIGCSQHNFSSTYVLKERAIVNFILFTRAKFSCCWFFRILITASAVDFFELPFAKVRFLWLDWRLLSTGCWSEFADRHMSSHLNALILWTYRSWTLHLDSRQFEICLLQIDQGIDKNSSWLIFKCLQISMI